MFAVICAVVYCIIVCPCSSVAHPGLTFCRLIKHQATVLQWMWLSVFLSDTLTFSYQDTSCITDMFWLQYLRTVSVNQFQCYTNQVTTFRAMNFDQSDEILLFSFCVCFTFISSAAPYPKPISSYLNYTNVHWRKYLVNVEWPKPKQSNLTAIICIKILLNCAKCSGVSSWFVFRCTTICV